MIFSSEREYTTITFNIIIDYAHENNKRNYSDMICQCFNLEFVDCKLQWKIKNIEQQQKQRHG
jgi:hypothetical protein